MSRRIGHITIALATLVLSGCGADNPAPPPLPTASQSASPTAATPPVMPDSARGTTRAAAKEFVRYYVAVMSYATRTGDTDLLRAASSKQCSACNSIAKSLEEIRDAGGRVETADLVVKHIVVDSVGPDGTLLLVADVSVPPQKVFETGSSEPQTFSGIDSDPHHFTLTKSNNGWTVTSLRYER